MPISIIRKKSKPKKMTLSAMKRQKEELGARKLELLVEALKLPSSHATVKATQRNLGIQKKDWPKYLHHKAFFFERCELASTLAHTISLIKIKEWLCLKINFVQWTIEEEVFTFPQAYDQLKQIALSKKVQFVDPSKIDELWISKNTAPPQPTRTHRAFYVYVRNRIRDHGYISAKRARKKAAELIGGSFTKKYSSNFNKLSSRIRGAFNLRLEGKNGQQKKWIKA